jgi:P27 family predicted phage terminase small subunit
MPGGRPAKPTHLKVLHGDDKKNPQRINRDEPLPADLPIEPPALLTEEGLAVWKRLAPDRIAKGLLTPWDVDAFALFCEGVALAHHAAFKADGPTIPGAQSPISRFKDAVAVCATLGGRFGWTPSDRAKLVVGEERRDQKERLLS